MHAIVLQTPGHSSVKFGVIKSGNIALKQFPSQTCGYERVIYSWIQQSAGV